MNIADIKAEFGSYYLSNPGNGNLARVFKLLNFASTTDTVLTDYFTDDTIYRASKASFERVLQPFQVKWTPIGQVSFEPIAIEMFKMKVDTEEYPDYLEGTWLGFLAGDGIDRKTWPFVRWFVEIFLLPQAKQDYELNEVFGGVFVAPVTGVAGAAGTAMNGLRKVINDNISAGRTTPIVMGAVPAANSDVVTYVESFCDKIDKRYWNIPMQLCTNETIVRQYLRGKRALYGRDIDFAGTDVKVDNTNITLIGLPSHRNSTKMWITPKNNVLHLKKKTQNQNAVMIESIDRLIKIFTDWWSGVGFILPEIVFTNDVDLV